MYSETLAAAKELNNQSNLLGVTLLGLPPEDAMYPGPNQYGDGNDYYSIFSYGDKACITEVEVSSPEANIYGIAPGDEAASIETILISQGYSLVSDDLSGEKDTIFYQKYHISIQLTVPRDSSDLDTAVITRIAIVVRDPDDVGAVF